MSVDTRNDDVALQIVLKMIEAGCFELGNLKAYKEFIRRANEGSLPASDPMFRSQYLMKFGAHDAAQLDVAPIIAVYEALKGPKPDLNDLANTAKAFRDALNELGIVVKQGQ